MRGAYSLGFYATTEPDNTWRRLDVKVQRRGVRLSTGKDIYRGCRRSAARLVRGPWSAAVTIRGSTNLRVDASAKSFERRIRGLEVVLLRRSRRFAFRGWAMKLGG